MYKIIIKTNNIHCFKIININTKKKIVFNVSNGIPSIKIITWYVHSEHIYSDLEILINLLEKNFYINKKEIKLLNPSFYLN